MKTAVFIALMVAGQFAVAQMPVQVNKGSPVAVVANCAANEMATLDLEYVNQLPQNNPQHTNQPDINSSTSYVMIAQCAPATCLVLNESNKRFSILREASVPIINQEIDGGNMDGKGPKFPAQQLVQNNFASQADAMAAAQQMLRDGKCAVVKKRYTNGVIDFIDQL